MGDKTFKTNPKQNKRLKPIAEGAKRSAHNSSVRFSHTPVRPAASSRQNTNSSSSVGVPDKNPTK